MMPDPGPFISQQHPTSRRHAIFDDYGPCAWLYLTAPDQTRPVADAWVYNRVPPPDAVDPAARDMPPIIKRFAGSGAVLDDPARFSWRFRWLADGEGVALLRDGVVEAVILPHCKRGFSANVVADGPWGSPLSAQVLRTIGIG